MSESIRIPQGDSSRRMTRGVALAALMVGLGVFVTVAVGRIGRNIVYYWGPSELRAAGEKAVGASIRLGGQVLPGSVGRLEDGDLAFDVGDGRNTVRVHTRIVPPQMFREGIGVVVEGTLDRQGVFQGARLLVSHGNEYRTPHTKERVDVRRLIQSTEGLDAPKGERRP